MRTFAFAIAICASFLTFKVASAQEMRNVHVLMCDTQEQVMDIINLHKTDGVEAATALYTLYTRMFSPFGGPICVIGFADIVKVEKKGENHVLTFPDGVYKLEVWFIISLTDNNEYYVAIFKKLTGA